MPFTQVESPNCGVRVVPAFSMSEVAASFHHMACKKPGGVLKREKPRLGLPGYDKAAPDGSRRDGPRKTPQTTRYSGYLSQGDSPY